MSRITSTLLGLGAIGSALAAPAPNSKDGQLYGPLHFNEDGTFHITVMQDTHMGDFAMEVYGPQQDAATLKVMRSILDEEKPDFVVINGDIMQGDALVLENATDYMDQVVTPMVERGLPWGSTYGNHDYQYNLTGRTILETEQKYVNARTKSMVKGDEAGESNYWLPVYAEDCQDCKKCVPELILWFFDSRGGVRFRELDEDGKKIPFGSWVHESVVSWFTKTRDRLERRYKKVVPSIGFVHMPMNASQALQGTTWDPKHHPGMNQDIPIHGQAQNYCPDGTMGDCTYGGQDIPFMKAIASTRGMLGLFSAHDHGQTWCIPWDKLVEGMDIEGTGTNLCFGQHTGFGGYSDWIRGARQIRVTQEGLRNSELDVWNRLEDGRVVGAVTLNSTYGSDVYPEVEQKEESFCDCDYPEEESFCDCDYPEEE